MSDLEALESKFSLTIGELLAQYGAVTNEVKETALQIQAHYIHLRSLYLSEENKDEKPIQEYFEENGWANEDGTLLLDNIILEFIDSAKKKNLTNIEKATELEAYFKQKLDDIYGNKKLSVDTLKRDIRNKNSLKSANKEVHINKGYPNNRKAISIGDIFEVIDTEIVAFNNILLALRHIVKSGLSQINEFEDLEEFNPKSPNFTADLNENSPEYLKKLHELQNHISSFQQRKEQDKNSAILSEEQFHTLIISLDEAKQSLEKKVRKLEGQKKSAVESLLSDLLSYRENLVELIKDKIGITLKSQPPPPPISLDTLGKVASDKTSSPSKPISEEDAMKAGIYSPKKPSTKCSGAHHQKCSRDLDGLFTKKQTGTASIWAAEDEIAEDAQSDEPINETRQQTQEQDYSKGVILGCLEKLHSGNIDTINCKTLKDNGSLAWIEATLKIEPKEKGLIKQLADAAQPSKVIFHDKEKGHRFKVTKKSIEHIDNDNEFSAREAIQMAWMASQTPKMLVKGITLTGSTEERAQLALAIEQINRELPKNSQLKIIGGTDGLNEEAITKAKTNLESEFSDSLDENGTIDFKAASLKTKPSKSQLPSPLKQTAQQNAP